ncbi:MAG TPA: hypothetical protein VGM63_15165 [Mucilaginibacter sp.]|jgi:hypothetical protein
MSSSQFDCSKLLVNFLNAPKGKRLVEYFPELAVFTEFTQQQDDNVIRIAILTADADSPFLKLRGDREKMITNIFEFLEIGIVNLKGKEYLQKVLDYKHEGVAACWSAYLQMQYNIDFSDWSISKQTYDMLIAESNRQRADGEDAVNYANWRVKLRNQIRLLGDDLKELEPKIFKDSKMAKPVAFEQLKKIRGYPEKYARTTSNV